MHLIAPVLALLISLAKVHGYSARSLRMIQTGNNLFKGIFSRFWRNPVTSETSSTPKEVIRKKIAIIGGGVSGLSCAIELTQRGENDFIILESSDDIGGRIRTDKVDGFLLDRGFQVFIDSYPQSIRLFDYAALNLAYFNPGAMVRYDNAFHIVSDPIRRPQDLIASIISPVGSLADKLIVGIYSILIRLKPLENIFQDPEVTTENFLLSKGLSSSMIDRFFVPFFQGIFLSSLEAQSSRMFEFVFKMFTIGSATIPSQGMGGLTQQLGRRLNSSSIVLNSRVTRLENNTISTIDTISGEISSYAADYVVLATEAPSARNIINSTESIDVPTARTSTCLYFSLSGSPPITEPVLILNADNKLAQSCFDSGVNPPILRINNMCFPSQISPAYAPPGMSLASITVVGDLSQVSDDELESAVRAQLVAWWGAQTEKWKLLRIYRIPYAQPAQQVPYMLEKPTRLRKGLYCCGDHRSTATLNGAIESGLRAATAVMQDINC